MTDEIRRAFAYLRPYGRRLWLVVALSLVSTAVALTMPYLSKGLIDQALLGGDRAALLRLVGAFIALGVVSFALNVASGLRYTRVSAEILFDMRLALYAHLQRLSPRFYARTRLGDIVARLNNDIAEIQRVAAEAALAWVGNVLFLAGSVAMTIWLDWRLALVSGVMLPFSLWALSRYRRALEGRVAELRDRSADIGSFLIESLQATPLIVASNAQARETARFARLNDRFIESLMAMRRVSYLAGGLPGLILSAGSGAVFLYGGSRILDGSLTLGTFAAFLAYQMRVMAPVQSLMGLYASLATARVSWTRVLTLLDAPVDVTERPDACALTAVRGEVTFDRVTLSTERGLPVLEEVTFTAHPGEVVAIVGASGSGKSTIANLLTRLLDPDEGAIRLDGVDLRDARLADVRRAVVLVEQEPALFHATIAENLRYVRPDATDDDISRAAESVGLAQFIARLPMGYETVVGERGQALSAGERQRLALARAFLATPTVLVLDEPTSALDPATEQLVIDGYRRLMQGRTTILISHRRELASQADRAIVLEDACIVESGTPAELAARHGRFAALFPPDRAVASRA